MTSDAVGSILHYPGNLHLHRGPVITAGRRSEIGIRDDTPQGAARPLLWDSVHGY